MCKLADDKISIVRDILAHGDEEAGHTLTCMDILRDYFNCLNRGGWTSCNSNRTKTKTKKQLKIAARACGRLAHVKKGLLLKITNTVNTPMHVMSSQN